MKICLCDKSALEFWRHFDNRVEGVRVFGHTPNAGPVLPSAFPSNHLQSVGFAGFGLTRSAVKALSPELVEILGKGELHILLEKEGRRAKLPGCRVHSLAEKPSRSSIFLISEDVCVVSPELLFLMLSKRLDFIERLLIGYELCGCYSLRPDMGGGLTQRHPLCSVRSLARVADCSSKIVGAAAAKKTLRYLRDGSGSPRETALVLLLCLPMSYGGFGLPFPELNYRLDLGESGSLLWDSANAFDLVWLKEKLVVEYDGRGAHGGFEAHERDSRRRAALVVAGYSVVVVTKGQLEDVKAFGAIAASIAKRLGKRLRFRVRDFEKKNEALLRRLLRSKPVE